MTAPARDPRPAAFDGHTTVAIVPITDNWDWVRTATWRLAQTAAATRPPVTLVDLCLVQSVLEAGNAGPTMNVGIVDAFEDQLPLDQVVASQPIPGLHYIAAGRPAKVPSRVWGNDRWKKLSLGFSTQDALLLLLIPPAGVAHLAITPDAIVILAREGDNSAPENLPALSPWTHQGIPFTEVITHPIAYRASDSDRTEPSGQTSSRKDTPSPVFRKKQTGGFPWKKPVVPVVLALGALTVGMILAERGKGGDSEGSVSSAILPPQQANLGPSSMAAPDSLFYSLQLAVYNSAEPAAAFAISLAERGFAATVSPARIGNNMWYRVLFGAIQGPEAAEALLRRLWRDGLVEEEHGTILRTPQALTVGTWDTEIEAEANAARFRSLGIPAYSVATASGTVRILVGAFETADQAARAESLLVADGITATTITRTGISP